MKAGGYGTAGWAVGGDVIVDMNKFVDADVEAPDAEGGYTSLRDMAPIGSKGKGKLVKMNIDTVSSGKRRRDEDADLRNYNSASGAVSGFLAGPSLVTDFADVARPTTRRRLDPQLSLTPVTREVSEESSLGENPSSSGHSSHGSTTALSRSQSSNEGASTAVTTPSSSHPPSGPDPFGYMDLDTAHKSYPSTSAPARSYRSFGPGTGSLFAHAGAPNVMGNLLDRASPIYSHAYVTFGAGMRQKEIDIHTAANPLEATSLSGLGVHIPYHVPL